MIYKKNYLKLLLSNELQRYDFHCFNDSYKLNYCNSQQWYKNCIIKTLNKPMSFYRKICIQYLVEQWIKNSSLQKWTASYGDYIKNLIKDGKEVTQELCISLIDHPIDPLILEEIGSVKSLTLKINDVTLDTLTNTEMIIRALMEHRNTNRNPLEINFDITWNNGKTNNGINKNIVEKDDDEDDTDEEINEKYEEQMEEIIHLINKYFNQQYIDYLPLTYSNRNGMI